jgi:hypothetical protein
MSNIRIGYIDGSRARTHGDLFRRIEVYKAERQGEQQGLARGLAAERMLLRRLGKRRFDDPATNRFAALLGLIDDPERLAEIGEWILDCNSGEDLVARMEGLRK